jgi:hypothetical protein
MHLTMASPSPEPPEDLVREPIDAVEAIEHARQDLGRNAGPGVRDLDADPRGLGRAVMRTEPPRGVAASALPTRLATARWKRVRSSRAGSGEVHPTLRVTPAAAAAAS